MPTDNVLIRINTIAGLAGIEEVKAGLLGLNATTLLLVAGLAAVYKIGTDGIANFKAQEDAVNQLNQAYATQGLTFEANRAALERFINLNAKFIQDQYDVMVAMAGLIRAGNSETDALRILGDALDLSALQHVQVSEAAKTLTLVLAGNSRALRELGITTDEYNAIMKNKLLTTEQKHLALLDLIEKKTVGGRLAVDEYTQSQNALNKAWQDFTGQTGGPLVGILTELNVALERGVEILNLYLQALGKVANMAAALELGFAGDIKKIVSLVPGSAALLGDTKSPVDQYGRPITTINLDVAPPQHTALKQPIVIHNKLVLGPHEIDLLSNTIIRNARTRPAT